MKKTFKKIIALVLTVMIACSALGIGASAAELKKLDLAFVIDTTGSMGDDIAAVKSNMTSYINDLNDSGISYRIAIIDYRDFFERTGDRRDYPFKVQLDFTNDYTAIMNGIKSLSLGYGGDDNETVCSALIDGVRELSWDKSAGKSIILMGDAPALDPEPYTNYTKEMAVNWLNGRDTALTEKAASFFSADASTKSGLGQITLFAIATSNSSSTRSDFSYLAEKTGGMYYTASSSSMISGIITEIIDTIPDIVPQPSFWDRLASFFRTIWYIITFQWSKI